MAFLYLFPLDEEFEALPIRWDFWIGKILLCETPYEVAFSELYRLIYGWDDIAAYGIKIFGWGVLTFLLIRLWSSDEVYFWCIFVNYKSDNFEICRFDKKFIYLLLFLIFMNNVNNSNKIKNRNLNIIFDIANDNIISNICMNKSVKFWISTF